MSSSSSAVAWPSRTAVAFVLVVVVCPAAYWAVERHTANLMRHPLWGRFDNGIVSGLLAALAVGTQRREAAPRSRADADQPV